MSFEPEISRRCPACGASVRTRARFCPQCGREAGRSGATAGAPVSPPIADPVTVEDDVVRPEMLTSADATGAEDVRAAAVETARPTSSAEMRIHPAAIRKEGRNDGEPGGTPEAANAQRTRSITTIQAAADTRFGVTPHVERLRQASTVVLDEAADDPEVRFLLVAVLLFVVFVVVLIVTSVIK